MRKILLGFVLVFTTLFTSVMAEDNPRAVIIFDASGSMWGQINGVTKIEIARDALKNVVKEWNPSVELGLTVYGHRSKGDCNDIETVIPVGKIDKSRVIKTVMGIKPKGKTPISRSLRKVAEEIKYTEEKATIILISDGKETCDPDPCGTAKELEKQGIDFVTHVIGFNVDKKTSQQLECIASATGGEYFSAKNAAALNKAMKVIAKKVEVVKPKPKPKPVVKKLKNNLEISASEKEGGKWIESYHRIYKIVEGAAEDSQVTGVSSRKKKIGVSKLDPGKYTAHSTYNEFKKDTPFEIKEGEVTKINIVMGQTGEIEISTSEKEGGKWIDAYHRIYKVIDGVKDDSQTESFSSRKKATGKAKISIGKYIIKSEYNEFTQETPCEVKAGETTKVHVAMGQTGEIEISASEKEGGKWIDAYHRIYKVIDGVKDDSQTTSFSSRKKATGKAKIAIGKYIVKSEYNEFTQETPFEVKAGETTKVHVAMGQTGEIEISASEKEGGKWIDAYHRIYKVIDGVKDDSQTESFSSRKKATGKAKIAIGKYIVKSEYNEFTQETPCEVKAGETTKVHVAMGQTGEIEISASEKEGGKWIDAYHRIYKVIDGVKDDSQTTSFSSRKKTTGKAKIAIGKYIVKSEYNNFKKETPFEIKAGETTKAHVTFGQFFIEAKCINMGDKISYEIYASSGQLVDEKTIKCSDALKITLDNGDYSVEAKVRNDKKEVEFTVGGSSSKLLIDMTDIKREPTKEELIKADSQETPTNIPAPKQEEPKSEKITLGDKQIEIKGISKEDAEKIKNLGAMLGAFGGMIKGVNPEEQKKQEEKQSADNAKADKEFDEMSKDLDMFTK